MTARRVLILGSYPAAQPRHGGQIRLAQIADLYRKLGLDVQVHTFFPAQPVYLDAGVGPQDTALPLARLQRWRGHAAPFIEDLASGEHVAQDTQRLARLEQAAGRCALVHVEQPWLFPVAQQLRARGQLGAFRLIYGSQNIEHRLKRAIFAQYRVAGGEPLLEGIEALERACAHAADRVIAVTREDAAELQAWTGQPVVLAANGVAPWRADAQRVMAWRKRLGGRPFALYVASAHPPNVVGFCESFGTCLAALAPDQRVVLAGSVSSHILDSDWFSRWGPLNLRRVVDAGTLDEAELSALREAAHAFVLPMTSGEGSNLKSAEALYAQRWVVATPRALRGFEAFADWPTLVVREPGAAFGQAVGHVLARPIPALDPARAQRRESLTWDLTLQPLAAAATQLLEHP